MRFYSFKLRDGGENVAINMDQIVSFRPCVGGTTIRMINGEQYIVTDTFFSVLNCGNDFPN